MSTFQPYIDELPDDPEWAELTRQAHLLQQPPWSFSGKWMSQAVTAIQQGRVHLGTPPSVVAEIVGQSGEIYTITGNTCTCPARRSRKDCYHPTAAELYRLYHGKLRMAQGLPSREPGDDEEPEDTEVPAPTENSPLTFSESQAAFEAPSVPQEPRMAQGMPGEELPPQESKSTPVGPQEVARMRQEENQQRHEIQRLLVLYGLKLTTKADYQTAVETHVGLPLIPENFAVIIARLEQMIAARRGALPSPKLLSDYMVDIKGKRHVQYGGLLAYAHEQGLVSLTVAFTTATKELAIATATATFQDGRTFTETADATPENVGTQIKPHFMRMAATRAKARALRDALNIAEAAAEEME